MTSTSKWMAIQTSQGETQTKGKSTIMVAVTEQIPNLDNLTVEQQLGILWRLVEVFFEQLQRSDEEIERLKDWKTRNHDQIIHLWMKRPGRSAALGLSAFQLKHLVEQLQPYLISESPCPLLRLRLQQIHY